MAVSWREQIAGLCCATAAVAATVTPDVRNWWLAGPLWLASAVFGWRYLFERGPDEQTRDKRGLMDNDQDKGGSRATGSNSPIVTQTGRHNIAQIGNNNEATINADVNPQDPVVAWDLKGVRRVRYADNRFVAEAGPETAVFQRFGELFKAHDFQGLLAEAESQVAKTPDWPTPYYYAGVAHVNLGDTKTGVEWLIVAVQKAGRDPQYSQFATLLEEAKRR